MPPPQTPHFKRPENKYRFGPTSPQNCFFFSRDANQFSELIYRVTVLAKQLNQASRFPFRLGVAPGSPLVICNYGAMCDRRWHVNILHAACVLYFLRPAENSHLAGRQAIRSTYKTFILRGFLGKGLFARFCRPSLVCLLQGAFGVAL